MASPAIKNDFIVLPIRTKHFCAARGAVHQFPVHLRSRFEWLFAAGALVNHDAGRDGSGSVAVVALDRRPGCGFISNETPTA